MTGLGDLADALSRALRPLAAWDDEDDRRGRRPSVGHTSAGGSGVRRASHGRESSGRESWGRAAPRGRSTQNNRSGGTADPQAAVVKIASFAAGRRRVGALTDYLGRDGALTVETETGELLRGRQALRCETDSWNDLFSNRAPSRDVATLKIAPIHSDADAITVCFGVQFWV